MTTLQARRLYFPTWNECFRTAWQKEPSGRIVPAPGSPESDMRDLVERHAETFAAAEVRGVVEADLRYAATALALAHAREHRCGRDVPLPSTPHSASSKHLDGLGLDMFRALCALAMNPDWLGPADTSGRPEPPGMIWWLNPELAEGNRMLSVLDRRTVPGYASELCRSLYGTREYRDLDVKRLGNLYRLMVSRKNAWHPRGSSRFETAVEDEIEVGA